MNKLFSKSLFILTLLTAVCQLPAATIANSGFESYTLVSNAARAAKDHGFGSWQSGANRRVPGKWLLNLTSPGRVEMISDGKSPEGSTHLKITADVDVKHKRGAHLYIAVNGLSVGKNYQFSAKMRNGKAALGLYEFSQNKTMRTVTLAMDECGAEWREVSGIYTVPENFRNAFLVIMVPWQSSVEIDDIRIKEVSAAAVKSNSQSAAFENEFMQMLITPESKLGKLYCKADKTEYAFPNCSDSICQVKVNGTVLRSNGFIRRGNDILELQFPDPSVKVALRIKAAKRYFIFEVVQASPENMEAMTIEFPMKKLDRKSTITSANFSKTFVANLFALNFAPYCTVYAAKDDSMRLAANFLKRHGYNGGKLALLGMPRKMFFEVAKDVQKDHNLPSPKLGGKWLRESENIRRSYLMVTDMESSDIDKLIEYAKIGNFQTIVFDKDQWLDTHGHYRINEKNFPGGLDGFKAAADKIHAAGLKIGVHLFGPSISSNDPYITPVPDKRLAGVNCPPLAEDIDENSTTVVLERHPSQLQPYGFPENHLCIGNEIIRYGKFETTPDKKFRFINCTRGAYGTQAAAHKAGSAVRGLITKLEFFMLEPQSELLEEVSTHFANIINKCNVDLVYFDASDCEIQARPMGYDLRRYVDQCHYTFYKKFDHDVLYQTSVGLGFNMQWHIVARGASANGFGDIKKLLAKHMRIITYAEHFAFADVGWYGLDPAIRVNAMEYIASKCLACDGSISIQGSRQTLDNHPQGREIFEMLNRYETCRVSNAFPKSVTDLLLDKDKDFRLYGNAADGWKLFEANFTPDKHVAAIDGKSNVWTVENKFNEAVPFALEILRYPVYTTANAIVLEDFANLAPLKQGSRGNSFHSQLPQDKMLANAHGIYTPGMQPNLTHTTYPAYHGTHSGYPQLVNNTGKVGSWTFGKTLPDTVDLSKSRELAFWLRSYAVSDVVFDIRLIDTRGKIYKQSVKMDYSGWKLHFFKLNTSEDIDWKNIKYLTMTLREIPPYTKFFRCMLAGVKALPGVQPPELRNMELSVNGKKVQFPMSLQQGASLTADPLGNCTVWSGGMKPGKNYKVPVAKLKLQPGKNTVEFRYKTGNRVGSDAIVRLIPLKKIAESK